MSEQPGFSIEGQREVMRNLTEVLTKLFAKAKKVIQQEGEVVLEEAKARAPHDTGALRRSGVVEVTRLGAKFSRKVEAKIGFGGDGETAVYAWAQHEETDGAGNPLPGAPFSHPSKRRIDNAAKKGTSEMLEGGAAGERKFLKNALDNSEAAFFRRVATELHLRKFTDFPEGGGK